MPTLLVIADTTPTRGGGVHLLPRLAEVDPTDRGPFDVTLVFPDGSERAARAVIDVPHVRGSAPPIGMLRLLEWSEPLPIGTRLVR